MKKMLLNYIYKSFEPVIPVTRSIPTTINLIEYSNNLFLIWKFAFMETATCNSKAGIGQIVRITKVNIFICIIVTMHNRDNPSINIVFSEFRLLLIE